MRLSPSLHFKGGDSHTALTDSTTGRLLSDMSFIRLKVRQSTKIYTTPSEENNYRISKLKQSKIEDNKYDVQENHRTIMADHQSYKEVTTFSFHPQDATLSHILFLHYQVTVRARLYTKHGEYGWELRPISSPKNIPGREKKALER